MRSVLSIIYILFAFTVSAQDKWKPLVASANKKMTDQNYEGALKDLDEATDDCPKCPTPHFRKVMVLAELKEFDKAKKELKKGREYSAESNAHYYYTAFLQWQMGEKQEALLTLQEFLNKDSTSALAATIYETRASIRLSQKLNDDAYADNLKILKIQPKNIHALASVIIHEIHSKDTAKAMQRLAAMNILDTSKSYTYNYEIGHIFYVLKRYKEALPFFERAFVINPKSNAALGYIGITYALLDNYDEALRYLEGLLKLAPNSAYARNCIGFVKIKQALYDEALPYLDKAIEMDPASYDAYNNRGYIFFKKGGRDNLKKALADYDKAVQIAPAFYEPYWKYKDLISL
jgi:tetratricopeptide (TPR) repeat protein